QIGAGAAEHGGGDVGTAGGAVVEDVAGVGDVPDGQNRRDADGPQMVLGLRELPLQTILAGLRAVLRTSGGGILVELRAGGPGVQNRQDPKHLSQRLNRQAVLAAHDLPQADGAERGAMIRHSGSALTALLTLLVLWAPLPFASATPWAVAIIQVCCFTALALAAAALRDGGRLRPALLPAAALAAVALLAFLQSLPWPGFVVSLLSPQHAAAAARAAALPEVSVAHRFLSLAPGASQAAALQWAALAAALLAGAAAGWRAARRWIAGAVILGGIFQAFFGAYAQYKRALTLWGVDVPRSPRLHGTFVNPNHLALFLELGLCVATAWGWWALRRTRDDEQPERRLLLLGPALCALTLLAGLVLTGSRAGLLAAAAGFTVQTLAAAAARRRWRRVVLSLGVALCGLGLVVVGVGAREGLGRFIDTRVNDVSLQGRLTEYRAVLRL